MFTKLNFSYGSRNPDCLFDDRLFKNSENLVILTVSSVFEIEIQVGSIAEIGPVLQFTLVSLSLDSFATQNSQFITPL
jgi:hypothetical protein